jgi:nitrate reductase NapE component
VKNIMMGTGFSLLLLIYSLLALGLVLGFSYIIWILAMKEAG